MDHNHHHYYHPNSYPSSKNKTETSKKSLLF
jgi:hypothetical protein